MPTPYFWPNFLYRVKFYSNELPPWSELCVANASTRGTYMQKASCAMLSLATIVETLSITSRVAEKGLETRWW